MTSLVELTFGAADAIITYVFAALIMWQGHKRQWSWFWLDRKLEKKEFLQRWAIVIVATLVLGMGLLALAMGTRDIDDWIYMLAVMLLTGLIKAVMFATVLQRGNKLECGINQIRWSIVLIIVLDLIGMMRFDKVWYACIYFYFAREIEEDEPKSAMQS